MEAGSGVLNGLLALPQGGGAMRGLGDRFQPDLLKGTGNYTVPIDGPKGPADLAPSLSLRYSTGLGNGAFGLGWRLGGVLEIRRRTDRGVPRYDDDLDEFVFSEAETLVPVGDGRYQPRTETAFFHIRRAGSGWQVRTKEGGASLLGQSAGARLADGPRVAAWLVEQQTDVSGNEITYRYEHDGGQVYLHEVVWGTASLRFVYEDRPDVVHDARGGFPVRTAKRCTSIERRIEGLAQPVVARYTLGYEQAPGSGLSLLTQVGLTGIAEDGEVEESPMLRLGYSTHQPSAARYHRVGRRGSIPPPLDRPATTLVDMDGDGLPDVLDTTGGRHRYWPNRGDGSFGPPRPLPLAPSGMELGRAGISFADLTGDGTADLFRGDNRLRLAVANTGAGAWAGRPVVLGGQLPLSLTATDSRLVDLDGDGVVDLLQSGPSGLVMTFNRPEGWTRPETAARVADAAAFPDVDLGQADIHLADMTGDGLSDVVFVGSGRVEYWPHHGHGRFGARVRMANPPLFPPRFDLERVLLADLDGDGTTDIVYVDHDRVSYWLNRSGLGWSERFDVRFVPPPHLASLHLADLLGSGTGGLLWSGGARSASEAGYHYLDLVPRKPYLLTTIDNGLAGVTELTYTTSSALRAADERAGTPWNSFLPFPVHVVSELTQHDLVTGRAVRTRFRYHCGYYDGAEREFRGFEHVTMETEGDDHSPTVAQVTEFFQGTMPGPVEAALVPAAERARIRALAGSPLAVRTYEVQHDGAQVLHQSALLMWDTRLLLADGDRFVHYPHLVRTEARDHVPGERDRIDVAEYEYDRVGNVTRKRRTGRFDGDPEPATLVSEQRLTYTDNEAAWLVGLPVSVEARDGGGRLLSRTVNHYDGPAFDGLAEGRAERGVLRRTRELALADHALPDGYAAEIDPTWALEHDGEGWYRTTVAYDHDSRGNVVAQRDGVGAEQTITYAADGIFPTRLVDPGGAVTEADFDARTGQPHEVRGPDGAVTRYRYSPLGRLRAQYDTTGDGSVQLSQVLLVDHGETSISPARPPAIISIKPLGPGADAGTLLVDPTPDALAALAGVSVTCAYYDGDGNLLQQVGRGPSGPDGTPRWVRSRRRAYTQLGRSAADYPNEFALSPAFDASPPSGAPVRFFYTVGGQARRIENPDGGRLQVRYLLNRLEKHDAEMPDDAPPMVERYDAWGRLVEVEQEAEPGTATTRYRVDILGRTVEVRDASGRALLISTFAGPGPPIRIVHGDAGARTYWRDARGLLRLRTDALGNRVATEYDDYGRMTRALDLTDPTAAVELRRLVHDGTRLMEAHDGDVHTTYGHDAVGRMVEQTVRVGSGPAITVRREYGPRGEPTAITYPEGTRVEYGYDETGSLRTASGFVDAVEYDAHGSPVTITFAGGASAQYDHDPVMRRLRSASLSGAQGLVRRVSLTHDRNGHVRTLTDDLAGEQLTRTFAYDRLYRLVGAGLHQGDHDGPLLRDDRYAYSMTGDLVRDDESTLGPLEYGDATHPGRLTRVRLGGSAGPVDLGYDAAGRMTSFGDLHGLRYDVWDRLVEVRKGDGTVVAFDYDHSGAMARRVVRSAGGTERETRSVDRLYETGPDGERLQVHLGRLLVAEVHRPPAGGARTAFVLTDHLGSVLAGCTAAGDVVHQQLYSPFGLSLRPSSPLDAYTGTKGEPELGLVLFGSRWYAPALGRFVTPDWFVAENPERALRLPQALNAYSYAVNNPLSFRDPTGMWFGIDDLIVAGVGFAVGFIAGTIYGLATGHSLGDSLLRGLEAGILGAVGAWLAWNTAGLALGLLGVSGASGVGFGIMVGAAVVGGMNGTISGMTRIYDWSSPSGWGAFLLDSSWGLAGTAMGNLLHIVNLFYGSSRNYRPELSERKNRHVYDGGFGFGNFAFTQGNVISNLNGRRTDLVDHEHLHVWQNRMFGPVFTLTYVAWLVVGALVGLAMAPFTDQSWKQDVKDVAYLNNPWETWAYDTGGSGNGGELSWT